MFAALVREAAALFLMAKSERSGAFCQMLAELREIPTISAISRTARPADRKSQARLRASVFITDNVAKDSDGI